MRFRSRFSEMKPGRFRTLVPPIPNYTMEVELADDERDVEGEEIYLEADDDSSILTDDKT